MPSHSVYTKCIPTPDACVRSDHMAAAKAVAKAAAKGYRSQTLFLPPEVGTANAAPR